MGKLGLRSVEDVSVMRKFSIFFVLLSVIPFVLLVVLFFILYVSGDIKVESDKLFIGFIFGVAFFMVLSFFAIRQTLHNMISVAKKLKEAVDGNNSASVTIKTSGDNEIAQLARSFNEITRKLEQNIKELEKSKRMLQTLLTNVASGVSFADNIDAFLDLIVKTTVGSLNARMGMVLLLQSDDLVVRGSSGVSDIAFSRNSRVGLEHSTLGWVVKEKKPLIVPKLSKIPSQSDSHRGPEIFEPPLVCVPLIYSNAVIGAFLISGRDSDDNFIEDDIVILSNISSQIALAMENSRLNSDAGRTYFETITALAIAVEARDVYSRGHSDRVSKYSVQVAKRLNLEERQIKIIENAGVLHDIGKIGVGDAILLKSGPLTDVERTIMQQHPSIGEGIIIPLHGFSALRDPVRHHHEWLNGEGYPDHLMGDQISIEARILTVSDCFDAMISTRPYRKAMSYEEAKGELNKYKGVRYDPRVVDALCAYFEEEVLSKQKTHI
ncbi:MAG: HD domain-containing protein [Candidatus Omnitrophica bacterium]|nr:HD domain-containing protein [Candidatus Omnitrophota bacterium]